ncbi:HtaA domain-containing protein [Salinibacterium hongtaonis]|uniref:HtaA domain-containing protein n=1 Tax=Homoserinimonas hongtaonis TaxID=2079791 RepID=UPI000D338B31|nr:HtaA domain-containing protein [Salinibacterium hongtaonis]AWB90105.1 hypothetical protein C2138_11625 [Salinibacterium hongtaonis]
MSETIASTGESPSIGTGLAWGVKDSFLRYITTMPGGSPTTSGDATTTRDGSFYFATADQSGFDTTALTGTIKFSGRINFVGHFGALSVSLVDPWLILDSEGGSLSVEWGTGPESRSEIVRVIPDAPVAAGSVLAWRAAETFLSPLAVAQFNSVYRAGEPFAPLAIRVLR